MVLIIIWFWLFYLFIKWILSDDNIKTDEIQDEFEEKLDSIKDVIEELDELYEEQAKRAYPTQVETLNSKIKTREKLLEELLSKI